MKSAIVAIDHSLEFGENFDGLCRQIRAFQKKASSMRSQLFP